MPVLDELTETGSRFESAYANGPYSAVSIPSFLTSQYHPEGVSEKATVATVLQNAGVTTSAFHSNVLVENEFGRVPGFDTYENFNIVDKKKNSQGRVSALYQQAVDGIKSRLGSLKPVLRSVRDSLVPESVRHQSTVYVDAEQTTDAVLSWLDDNLDEEAFVWVHYMDPHRPYGVPPAGQHYLDEEVGRNEIAELMRAAGTSPASITESERRRLIDLYDSDLRYVSAQLARLFDGLRQRGVWEETTIVLTADHGEEFGKHGMYFHRNDPYEELIRVPLFVKNSTLAGPRTDRRALVDVAPTVCDVHGVEPHGEFVGNSLLERSNDRCLIATGSISGTEQTVVVRRGSWKLFASDGEARELYDLDSDPDEQSSVLDAHPDVAAELIEEIPSGVFGREERSEFEVEDDRVERTLSELGYLE